MSGPLYDDQELGRLSHLPQPSPASASHDVQYQTERTAMSASKVGAPLHLQSARLRPRFALRLHFRSFPEMAGWVTRDGSSVALIWAGRVFLMPDEGEGSRKAGGKPSLGASG
jgi:hypothetical protein